MNRLVSVLLIVQALLVPRSVISRPVHRPHKLGQWRDAHELGHLPELPRRERGLQASERNTSVAICASMKDENSTDVREWLLYYRWLGVDHVYLTDNTNTPSSDMREQLQDFVDTRFVTYDVERVEMAQMKVYYDCMRRHYKEHDWLAFFDLDEYLVMFERPQQKLPQFLDRYQEFPGLSVHWVLVGPSGLSERPASGGALRHYTECAGTGNRGVKTIANTMFLANISPHPHNFEFRDGLQSVDEMTNPVPFSDDILCSPFAPASSAALSSSGANHGYVRSRRGLYCYKKAGPAKDTSSIEKIALFHYVTKSQADFAAKIKRGPGIGRAKTWDFFFNTTRETNQRGGICDIPEGLSAECCPEEDLVLHA